MLLVCGGLLLAARPVAAQEEAVPPVVEGETPRPAPEEAAAAPASANPHAGLKLENLAATRDLPLFTPSRTPPVVFEPQPDPEPEPTEPEIAMEPDPEPPPLELIGIVVTGAEQVVLLMDQSSGEVQRVRPGEDYAGWTVTVLDSRSVELESDGHFQTLTMFTDTGEQPDAGVGEDWDGDGIPDEQVDPAAQGEDLDGDGIPDEEANPAAEGEDWDGDGIPDEQAGFGEAGASEPAFEGEEMFEQPNAEPSEENLDQNEEREE
jgi:general secretion pathway protein N